MRKKPERCCRCKAIDPPEGFYANGYCKPCGREYNNARRLTKVEEIRTQKRRRYAANPEKYRAEAAFYSQKKKANVIATYGGRCACCGESRIEFLSIDHVNEDGKEHRDELKRMGTQLYTWLMVQGVRPGFQVLCLNCNTAKGRFGYCPHQSGSHYDPDGPDCWVDRTTSNHYIKE